MGYYYIYSIDEKPITKYLLNELSVEYHFENDNILPEYWYMAVKKIDPREGVKILCEKLSLEASDFFTYTDNSITFLPGFIKAYFQNQYEIALERIKSMSLEDFCNEDHINLLKDLLCPTFDDLIYFNNEYLKFSTFIRNLNSEEPQTFFFGSIFKVRY